MIQTVRDHRIKLLHLFTLTTLGISQPLFDLLGSNIQFFLVRDAGIIELATFIIIAWAAPATILFFVYRLSHFINPRAGEITYYCSLVLLLSCISLQLAKHLLDASDTVVIVAALAGSTALTLLYINTAAMRSVLTYMGVIVPLAPVVFLFNYNQGLSLRSAHETIAPTASKPAPVVMIIFDELPLSILLDEDGKIDESRFPNFAYLERTSSWYRNASTVSDNTDLAVPAILTGTLPDIGELEKTPLPTYANYPRNIFTLLGETHQIHASESISRLCPKTLCRRPDGVDTPDFTGLPMLLEDLLVVYLHILLPEAKRSSLPPLHQNWGGFRLMGKPLNNVFDYLFKPKVVARSLNSIQKAQGLTVHFLHLIMPHQPWNFYPTGKLYSRYPGHDMLGTDWKEMHHTWGNDLRALEVAFQRLLMQAAFADNILGDVLKAIEASANHENTLLIVTSDHGANISAGGQLRWAYPENLRQVMAVPLFIRYPRQSEGIKNLDNVELTDVLPTIDELMKIDSRWEFAGQSLLHKIERQSKILLSPIGKLRNEHKHSVRLKTNELLVGPHPLRRALSPSVIDQPFSLASDANFLSKHISDFRIDSSGQTAYIRDLHAFSNVKIDGNFVPGLVRTRLPENWLRGTRSFAIALNGEIRATAKVNLENGAAFDTILPQNSFLNGKNKLSIYLIDDSSDTTSLLLSISLKNDD